MTRLARQRLAFGIAAAAAVATASSLAISASASAHDDPHPTPTPSPTGAPTDAAGPAVYFAAALNGRNEVPAPGGGPVGDRDGQAVQLVKIQGNTVSYALTWKNIAPPTASHIHLGARGINGAVKIPFFAGALPGSLGAVTGSVTVTDQALLNDLKANPNGFYANLHNADFKDGAVRGQLHKLTNPVDLTSVLRRSPFTALLDGEQEVQVPGGPAAGDLDGNATSFVGARGDRVNFGFRWFGIGAPKDAHLHQGTIGVNGPVAVPLFSAPAGLPASINGVAGTVTGIKADLTAKISQTPAGFYANLHTAEFPAGAVRGQLFRAGGGLPTNVPGAFNAKVLSGEQIYACTKGTDGRFTFTQNNVRATLERGVAHSFVTPTAGPPQWVAPDGSAVTGKLITRIPNGTANIPELDLAATSSGKPAGLFANAVEILRLNTVGGIPPAGTCDPKTHPIAKSPYQADYLFITK